jgi:6-phosphogluconolactonase
MHGDLRIVEDVPQAFADLVAAESPRSIALSGGGTARHCYERVAAASPMWGDVSVFFGDERWVAVDDAESNEGMARQVLLAAARPAAIHSLSGAGAGIDEAAAAYDTLLRAEPPIDLVHLGLGPDGHTASLFPGALSLQETERLVVPAGDDLHPHPRLTFTLPALARARLVVFTVAGEERRDAFVRVREGADLPAARVDAARVVWLADRAAAGG